MIYVVTGNVAPILQDQTMQSMLAISMTSADAIAVPVPDYCLTKS